MYWFFPPAAWVKELLWKFGKSTYAYGGLSVPNCNHVDEKCRLQDIHDLHVGWVLWFL